MPEPPVFKVRKSNTGLSWVVEIIWGGQTEAIEASPAKRLPPIGSPKSTRYWRKKNESPFGMNRRT